MKYSTRLSDAAHVLLFVCLNPNGDLSSGAIATSIQTNPSYVRQLMSALRKAGIINSSRGTAAPSLARPASEVTLLDLYRAVEGDRPLLHQDTHTNPDCGTGVSIQLMLRDCYDRVQKSAEQEMAAITLDDMLEGYWKKAGLPGPAGVRATRLPS